MTKSLKSSFALCDQKSERGILHSIQNQSLPAVGVKVLLVDDDPDFAKVLLSFPLFSFTFGSEITLTNNKQQNKHQNKKQNN